EVTQSRQPTISATVAIPPAHDPPPGRLTSGQVVANPISAGVKSLVPLHALSAPPHALQIVALVFASALAIVTAAFPSAAGQAPAAFPTFTAFQHLASAFSCMTRKAAVALPIFAWQ